MAFTCGDYKVYFKQCNAKYLAQCQGQNDLTINVVDDDSNYNYKRNSY